MCLNATFRDGGKVSGKIKPKTFYSGAKLKAKDKNIPSDLVKKQDPDRILIRAAPGELIIPVKHVKKVEQFLKTKKIKLRGMK